jgi:hypothetical protein
MDGSSWGLFSLLRRITKDIAALRRSLCSYFITSAKVEETVEYIKSWASKSKHRTGRNVQRESSSGFLDADNDR